MDHLVRLAGGDARRSLTYLEAATVLDVPVGTVNPQGGGYGGEEYLWSGTFVYDGRVYAMTNLGAVAAAVWRRPDLSGEYQLGPDGSVADPFYMGLQIANIPLADAAKVLDAVKDPVSGYYDTLDPFTALPKALVSAEPYARSTIDDAQLQRAPQALKGLRVAPKLEELGEEPQQQRRIHARADGQ